MDINTDWEIKLIEEARRVTTHGFGKVELKASESRDRKIKVIIEAGVSWVFFITDEIDLDKKGII